MNRLFFNISKFARLSWIKSSGEEERARHGETEGQLALQVILRLSKAVKLELPLTWKWQILCVLWIHAFGANWVHVGLLLWINQYSTHGWGWFLACVSIMRPWESYLWISSFWLPGGNTLPRSGPNSSGMCPSFSQFMSLSLFLSSKMQKFTLIYFISKGW